LATVCSTGHGLTILSPARRAATPNDRSERTVAVRVDDRYREERVHVIASLIKEQMARIGVTANLRLVD
jgi:hypothetical protein